MMHYDSALYKEFPSNNGDDPILLNKEFISFRPLINEGLRERDRDSYSLKDRKLMKKCSEHIDHFSKDIRGGPVVSLTHPFYLGLSQFHKINGHEKDFIKYQDNLNKLFFEKKDRKIVVFETVHHYAAITSRLLEEGIIDNVVITDYDYGYPFDRDDLNIFEDNSIYVGGGYDCRCLNSTIQRLKRVCDPKKIFGVLGLCLNPPSNRNLISMRLDKIPFSNLIGFEDFMKLDFAKKN